MTLRRVLRDRRGMTIVELCIVIVILGILMVTGVATLMRARLNSNESAAIGGLRATVSAQFAYLAACGQGNYATSYVILGTKPSANNQGFISPDLGQATSQKSGYAVTLAASGAAIAGVTDCTAAANPVNTDFYGSAIPQNFGTTGGRSFATMASGTIYFANAAAAPTAAVIQAGTATPLQ